MNITISFKSIESDLEPEITGIRGSRQSTKGKYNC